MSLLTIPNTFANGTGPANIIDATLMNANFTAIATAVNNIYPSQILPITTGQATFGATATGVGYKFLANDATATPLTISGVTSQSVDLLDVTLTSGGTLALSVNKGGALVFGSGLGTALPNGPAITGGTSGSLILNTTASQPLQFTSGVSSATILGQFNTNNSFQLNSGNSNGGQAGDLAIGRSAAVALLFMGQNASTAGRFDFGVATAGEFSFQNTGGVYVQVNGSTYNNLSDGTLKKDFALIQNPLELLMRLQPGTFTWISDERPDIGFRAQDVEGVLPQIVKADNDNIKALAYHGITTLNTAAIQDMMAKLKAAGVTGF